MPRHPDGSLVFSKFKETQRNTRFEKYHRQLWKWQIAKPFQCSSANQEFEMSLKMAPNTTKQVILRTFHIPIYLCMALKRTARIVVNVDNSTFRITWKIHANISFDFSEFFINLLFLFHLCFLNKWLQRPWNTCDLDENFWSAFYTNGGGEYLFEKVKLSEIKLLFLLCKTIFDWF